MSPRVDGRWPPHARNLQIVESACKVGWCGVSTLLPRWDLPCMERGEFVILWAPVSLAAFNLSQSQLGKSKKHIPHTFERWYTLYLDMF